MALKPLQSAFYARQQPRLRSGLTMDELDADYGRLQDALRFEPGLTMAETDRAYARLQAALVEDYPNYGEEAQIRVRRPVPSRRRQR